MTMMSLAYAAGRLRLSRRIVPKVSLSHPFGSASTKVTGTSNENSRPLPRCEQSPHQVSPDEISRPIGKHRGEVTGLWDVRSGHPVRLLGLPHPKNPPTAVRGLGPYEARGKSLE